MTNVEGLTQAQLDEHFLRHCFDVARRSMGNGNHPFGAVLVDRNRKVLIEAENGYMPSHDGTAHAERLLATEACRTLDASILAEATITHRDAGGLSTVMALPASKDPKSHALRSWVPAWTAAA